MMKLNNLFGKKKPKGIEIRVLKILANSDSVILQGYDLGSSISIPETKEVYKKRTKVSSFWLPDKFLIFFPKWYKTYMVYEGYPFLMSWTEKLDGNGKREDISFDKFDASAEELDRLKDIAVLDQLLNVKKESSTSMSILLIGMGIIIGFILSDSGMLSGLI